MSLCPVDVSHLFTPHLCVLHLCVCVCVTPMFSVPPLMFQMWVCFQNNEQLRDHDSDLLRNDGDLTFMFGDTAITANGASGSGGDAAGGSSWSANGKRSGSTSEEALERELDSREQELLSRGTRLVFPIEDHVWPSPFPFSSNRPDLHPRTPQLSLHPVGQSVQSFRDKTECRCGCWQKKKGGFRATLSSSPAREQSSRSNSSSLQSWTWRWTLHALILFFSRTDFPLHKLEGNLSMRDERTKHPHARCTFEHVTLCMFSWSCKVAWQPSVARVRLHTTPVERWEKPAWFLLLDAHMRPNTHQKKNIKKTQKTLQQIKQKELSVKCAPFIRSC